MLCIYIGSRFTEYTQEINTNPVILLLFHGIGAGAIRIFSSFIFTSMFSQMTISDDPKSFETKGTPMNSASLILIKSTHPYFPSSSYNPSMTLINITFDETSYNN